jgi:hypothetical protein
MPFIGFECFADSEVTSGTFSEPSSTNSTSNDTEPVYSGGDGEIAVVLKKLTKKDAVTKLKGLSELRELCRTKDIGEIRKLVPHWNHLYLRLCFDRDRRVRESLHLALDTLVKAVPKAFTNRITTIIGKINPKYTSQLKLF